ncbi:hypothetical protein ACWGB8_26570 [Kitasatospora sp. NPDC054939]
MPTRWSWLEVSTGRRPRSTGDRRRGAHFETVEAARADLQRHLDRTAAEDREAAAAAARLRTRPAAARNLLLRRRGWTLYAIPDPLPPEEAARRAEVRLHNLLRREASTGAIVAGFLLVLLISGAGLVQSGIAKLGQDTPRCHGNPMHPGDICKPKPGAVLTDGMPAPSSTTYDEQLHNLVREGWTTIVLGLVLLTFFLVAAVRRIRRGPAR